MKKLEELGKQVDNVVLEIDYNIIEHFSRHLYGSPTKAVEELVSNSFDAFAEAVYVYVPGSYTTDHVIVWDDGDSMDVQGLKDLWVLARSPKSQLGIDRTAKGRNGKERPMIGKFGIGKLASYAVGGSIAHLCRREDEYFLVSVNYIQV